MDRRAEGIVDEHLDLAVLGQAGERGDINDTKQGVGGCLDPDQAGLLGDPLGDQPDALEAYTVLPDGLRQRLTKE